jgi:hypothetical protein
MIWKAIALFGAGSFFYVGWGVLTDPLCNSVSFRGGGARTVVTTCFADSSGDFSRTFAVTGSFLIGLAILTILFWPLINVYIANYKFQLSLKQMAQEIDEKQEGENSESSTSPGESTQRDSNILSSLRKLSENKLVTIGLIAVLALGFYKIAAPKISLLNPITCSSLKKELAAKDVVGRQLWNSYQVEVSNLSMVQTYSNEYYLQVGNTARRALQLAINDLAGYQMLNEKPHCVKDMPVLTSAIKITSQTVDYLSGRTEIDGKKFDIYNGWNTSYYNSYTEFKNLLR